MKTLITRWTCTRCETTKEEYGDKPMPANWREIGFNLFQTRKLFHLCRGCVRDLEWWLKGDRPRFIPESDGRSMRDLLKDIEHE